MKKISTSEYLTIRGLRYHIRHWGENRHPKLFLLHGWMDVSASFQFVVDELTKDWHIIAPDWRGFGYSEWTKNDCYWFPDYLADLEAILNHYAHAEAINLVGHSMGGNIALLYGGIRTQRIRRLINLEGFGMLPSRAEQAPSHYAQWLDDLNRGKTMRSYDDLDQVIERLQKNNPRLSSNKARFLAEHWAHKNADGKWKILGDPAHKIINPVLYRLEEAQACWANISAPVLHVEALQTEMQTWLSKNGSTAPSMDSFRQRFDVIPMRYDFFIDNAGHMVHHDQPKQVAQLIEDFCSDIYSQLFSEHRHISM